MSRSKKYLKVKFHTCPECENTREVVIRGFANSRGKEVGFTERIVGIDCKKCGLQQPIDLSVI